MNPLSDEELIRQRLEAIVVPERGPEHDELTPRGKPESPLT